MKNALHALRYPRSTLAPLLIWVLTMLRREDLAPWLEIAGDEIQRGRHR